jgi:hypothetical protein
MGHYPKSGEAIRTQIWLVPARSMQPRQNTFVRALKRLHIRLSCPESEGSGVAAGRLPKDHVCQLDRELGMIPDSGEHERLASEYI